MVLSTACSGPLESVPERSALAGSRNGLERCQQSIRSNKYILYVNFATGCCSAFLFFPHFEMSVTENKCHRRSSEGAFSAQTETGTKEPKALKTGTNSRNKSTFIMLMFTFYTTFQERRQIRPKQIEKWRLGLRWLQENNSRCVAVCSSLLCSCDVWVDVGKETCRSGKGDWRQNARLHSSKDPLSDFPD